MILKHLSKVQLDQRIKSLAQKERDLLHEVLLTLNEIDSRRIYLELGFGSLFDYLVKGIGYSEGSAQRRIDAARMIREVPSLAEKIQSGELKLNQVSLVQKASREIFKTQSIKVTSQQKIQVIGALCGKNHAQSQQQVAAFFDLPVLQNSQQKTQADESVRVEMTLSKEAFAKVQQAQELLSHAAGTRDLGQFLEFLCEKVIKQKTGSVKTVEKAIELTNLDNEVNEDKSFGRSDKILGTPTEPHKNSFTATVAVKSGPSVRDLKTLRSQQRCCQFMDPQTGRRCESSWKLQVDHKQPKWAGGSHDAKNLQLLCADHNRTKYRKEAGIRYLS